MNAKFEQITANAEMNNAELTSRIDAQKVCLTEALEHSNADINAEIKQTKKELTVKVTEIAESAKNLDTKVTAIGESCLLYTSRCV